MNLLEIINSYFDLQKKLVPVFENSVEIAPVHPLLVEKFPHLKIIKPGSLVSEIMLAWPAGKYWPPLSAWVKPGVGLIEVDNKHWRYNVHGSFQVSFCCMPLDMTLEQFDAINFIFGEKSKHNVGPLIDMEYRRLTNETQLYFGVTPWELRLFVNSLSNGAGKIFSKDIISAELDKLVASGNLIKKEISITSVYSLG